MSWYESSQKPAQITSPDPAVISQMKSIMRAEVAKWAPQCKIIKFRFDPEDGGRLHAAIQGGKSGELVNGATMRYGRKTVESSGGRWDDSGIAMDLALDSKRSRLHAALDHVLDTKKRVKDSSEIDEAEAFDIGFADAEKGRAANPRPDWTPWLKKAYGEGYKSGSKKAK